MNEETPITKYLANLEKRQSIMFGGEGNSPSTTPPANIKMKLNFEDDTFLFAHEHSLLHISPNLLTKSAAKRKRMSTSYTMYEDKEDEEQQKKISDLERLLRQTQAELIDSRVLVTKLEHRNNLQKSTHAELLIGFQKANSEMKAKTSEAVEKVEDLEKQLKTSVDREQELRDRLHKQTEAHSVKLNGMEGRIAKLQTENMELKQKLEREINKSGDEIRKLSSDLGETERGAEKWVMETQLLKDQLTLKDSQLRKYQQELKEAQQLVFKYHEMKRKYEQTPESEPQSQSLEERLKRFENLFCKQQNENVNLVKTMKKIEEENKYLRSTVTSEMVLEEKISSLEYQLNKVNKELESKTATDAEVKILTDDLNRWKSVAAKVDTVCVTPSSFEARLRQTQNLLLELKHDNTNLQFKVENSSRLVNTVQAEAVSLRDQLKTSKEEKEKLTVDVKKISKRMILIAKDRDGLKGLKESYEQEFDGDISPPLKERILQLEEIVTDYEAMLNEDPSSKKTCCECEQRMALVSQLRSELETTRKELRETTALANVTASEAKSADDTTTGVKIVAFGMNPSILSMEERIKELNSENDRLKEKIKEFEDQTILEGKGNTATLEEKKKLEESLKTLERKHEILTEAYDYETQQLQAAIFKLFGYHCTLVREPQSQIRLQSIYSNSPEEIFVFQEADNGDMMLLETSILNHFRDDIERFLVRDGSIPAFIASVTITYTQGLGQQQDEDVSHLPSSQDSNANSQGSEAGVVSVEVGNDDDEDEEGEEEEEPDIYDDIEEGEVDGIDDEDDDDVVTIDDD